MRPARAPALAVIACCASCATHVVLDRPPSPAAPRAVRESYLDDHRLAPAERGDFVVRTRPFDEKPSITRRRAELRNGLPIERVEDLRPLVPVDSESARAMDDAVAARDRADLFTGGGIGLAIVGLGAGAALFATDLGVIPGTAQVPTQEQGAPVLIIVGIGSAAVGAVTGGVLVTFGTLARDDEDDATMRAFGAFDADLRALLALDVPQPAPAAPGPAEPASAAPPAEPAPAPAAPTPPAPDAEVPAPADPATAAPTPTPG